MKKILFMLMAILALTACSDDNVSDLNLDGSCSITELALDKYDGTIDKYYSHDYRASARDLRLSLR